MTIVDMKCRSCGATLKACDGYMVCEYCGSVYFRLEKSSVPEGVDALSLGEFIKAADENLETYCINRAQGTISDADADLVGNKLKAAERALANAEFFKVKDFLKGVPDDLFAAERLRLLAAVNAKSETELAMFAGDLSAFDDYAKLTACCDAQTKDIYDTIRKKCLDNAKLLSAVAKGNELIRIENYAEALDYAKTLTSRHPFSSRVRALLIKASCFAVDGYDPTDDLKRLEACPDAAIALAVSDKDVYGVPINLDPSVRDYCRKFYSSKRRTGGFFAKYLLKPLLVLIAVGALIGIWQLISYLFG